MFDVFDETIFDAGGVFFESEDEAWETNASEADKRHFNWDKWVFKREKDEDDGEDGGVDGFREEERGGALKIVNRLAALGDDGRNGSKI